jgi:hypothetical protein
MKQKPQKKANMRNLIGKVKFVLTALRYEDGKFWNPVDGSMYYAELNLHNRS